METIAVFFGGRSAEHDVSIVTALASIIKPLELTKKYKVEAVYIAKDGAWYWDEKLKDIKLFTSGAIQDFIHKAQPASVQFVPSCELYPAMALWPEVASLQRAALSQYGVLGTASAGR